MNLLRTADGWQTELPLTDEEAAQASEFAAAWSLLDQDAHRKLLPHILEQVMFDAPGETITVTLDRICCKFSGRRDTFKRQDLPHFK